MRTFLIAALLSSAFAITPLIAQTPPTVLDLRVGKLEKEMKAVQRTVFPNGVAVEPEISGTTLPNGGTPASAPLADLTARVDALEAQLKALTGQSEQDGFRLKKLEDAVKAMRTETDARIKALESGASTETTVGAATPVAVQPTPVAVKPPPPKPVEPLVRPAAAKPPVAVKPDAARKEKLAAVEIPASGDATEDAYTYAFRLWTAKLYPEAQVKLKEFVAKYPSHKRASYAQNLLGRAYLDEGKPALASVAFYDNYQKNPRGERAAESLVWLGTALTKLKKPADACKVYAEFAEVYGSSAAGDLKARVAKGRSDAKCGT
ncbi:MAG: tetratricopeptide repeat protein [Sphingomonadaceae bacterium]